MAINKWQSTNDNFSYAAHANLGMNFNRQLNAPLDVSCEFSSIKDMLYYVTEGRYPVGGTGVSDFVKSMARFPYLGQIIALVSKDPESVTLYYVKTASTPSFTETTDTAVFEHYFEEVGRATVGDDKSIYLDEDSGTLSIKNYGVEYYAWDSANKCYNATPTTGWKEDLTPRVKDIGTAEVHNYVIAWYETNGITVKGLDTRVTSLETTVGDSTSGLVKRVGDLETTSTDHENRLDTLEGDDTTTGSVSKKIKDAIAELDGTAIVVEPDAEHAGDYKLYTTVSETDGKITTGSASIALKEVATTGAAANVSITDSSSKFTATDVDAALTELVDKIGAADGVASLDSNTKIPLNQLPDIILGQLLFGGSFNNSGIATISGNLKTKLGISDTTIQIIDSATDDTTANPKEYGYKTLEGVYFIADATFTLSGVTFESGDWLISTGSAWKKIDNTDAVTGVKGNAESTYRIGNVNITPANIGLGAVVNTGDSDTPVEGGTDKFTTGGAYTELAKKADKVTGATADNFAGLDANGNLKDSGKKASDFATAAQGTKADSAVQGVKVNGTELTKDDDNKVNVTVAEGSANGTVKVNGTDVAVHGLDSAAYTPTTDYATAAQGTTADSALQAVTIAGHELTKTGTTEVTVAQLKTDLGLGSAAYTETSAYATAAQGTKADSAIQGVKVGSTTLSPAADKTVTIPAAVASTSGVGGTDGYMSAADKEKIDNLGTTYKEKQTAVVDPTASGNGTTFIATISQDEQGVITATKQTIDLSSKQDTLAFDGTYNADTNKVATESTVTNAIEALVVSDITGMGAGKTIATLTETDGKIAATFQDISITASQVSGVKTTQTAYDSGETATNKFVTRVEQNANGEVTITKGDVSFADLDGTATIATVADDVVTLKAGVKEVDGIVSQGDDTDITLAKVAKTGSATDVTATGFTATTVQGALEEVNTAVGTETTRATGAESALSTRIENLEARGRFLSSWDATTGLPADYPEIPSTATTTYTYDYKVGDYYIVGTAGTTGSNYQPSGASITATKSGDTWNWSVGHAADSREVGVGDYYICSTISGTDPKTATWVLISNSQKTVSFENIAGDADDNISLKGKLDTLRNGKVDKTTTIAGVDLSDNITKAELLTAINVEDGAQVNIIESLSVNGTAATISGKAATVTLPAATASALGLVKVDDDTIAVDADGELSIKGIYFGQDINGNDLYIQKGDTITINGGEA